MSGLEVVKYGLAIARKGGLPKDMCLNAHNYLETGKSRVDNISGV
ncbi:MAG: hypothetical protein R2778_04655 [Saprospiraceae bacterium]